MSSSLSHRLISLDAMRGFTIAAMIIVNDPGSWDHVYAPLLHKDWNGVTPTDFIYPFFLFIVGVSIALAYQKRLDKKADKGDLVKKIVMRSLIIFALGIFLWLWPDFDFSCTIFGLIPWPPANQELCTSTGFLPALIIRCNIKKK